MQVCTNDDFDDAIDSCASLTILLMGLEEDHEIVLFQVQEMLCTLCQDDAQIPLLSSALDPGLL